MKAVKRQSNNTNSNLVQSANATRLSAAKQPAVMTICDAVVLVGPFMFLLSLDELTVMTWLCDELTLWRDDWKPNQARVLLRPRPHRDTGIADQTRRGVSGAWQEWRSTCWLHVMHVGGCCWVHWMSCITLCDVLWCHCSRDAEQTDT